MSVLNKVNVISSLGYGCKICQKLDYRRQDSIAGVFSTYTHSWLTCGPDLFVVNNRDGVLQSYWTFGENLQDDLEITCAAELAMEGCAIPLLIVGVGSENKNLISFFNPNTRKILRTIDIIHPVRTVCVIEDGTNEVNPLNDALSPTEGLIAVGCAEGTVVLIDLCRSILCKAINGDFRFYSNEDNPSDAFYVEVDSINSSVFQQQVVECRKKMNSVSVILTDPSDEGITALIYSVEAAVLFVGTSSGSFHMWNMSSLSCLFKSPSTNRAIISLSLLEPCDDPRHSLYLWMCFDEYAQVAMYCISFSSKFFVQGYGVYYQNFESAGLVYRFTLGMEVDVLAKRPICSQAVAKLVPKNLVRCISVPEAEGTQLRVFITTYEIVDKGQISFRAVIFDLNQWYRDQMPEEGISSCLDSIDLDSKSLWHLQLDPSSLTLYQCVRPQEQHFHPTSFDFEVWCIEEEGIRCLEKLGLQSQWLRNMSRMGSKALLEPTRVFLGALAAGLLPSFIDPPDPEANNQVEERSYVLTVCLENRAIVVIEDCAKEWNNGSHTVRGCTIQYLLDWLWGLHRTYKSNGNKICVPLFDQSGIKFDISEKRSLQHCKSLLNTVQSIYANIVHKYSNILINGVEEKLTAMSLVRLYFDCCLKLISVNLLPEPNELGKPSGSVIYAYDTIKNIVDERRIESTFLGDSLFGKTDAESQWVEEGGAGHYPPPSIQSVLRFCLHPSPSVANKMALLLYLFMDITNSYTPIRSQPVLDRIKNFQHLMRISEVQFKIVAGCWYLDNSIYEEGVDLLLDPRVLSVDLSEDQHRDILNLLAKKGQEKLALQYLRLKSPSLHLEEDLRMELNLLLSNHLVNEAFMFQRKHPEMRETLLIEFFQGCIERKQLGQVFGLNLDLKEESVLMKYLKSSGLREKGDLQVLLLLSKAKYTEAVYLNDRLNSFINGPKSRIETDTRDMIVKGITGSLNSISRHMAHEMKTYHPPPSGLQPQPLSTVIKVRNGPDGPLCQTDSNVLLSAVAKSTRHLSDFVNSFESGRRRKREEEDIFIDFEDAPSRKRPKLWDTASVSYGVSQLSPLDKKFLPSLYKPSTPQERNIMDLVGTPLVKKSGKRFSPQSRPSSILKGKTPDKSLMAEELVETPKKSIRFTLPENEIQISARKPLHENEILPADKSLKIVMETENQASALNMENNPKSKVFRKRVSGRKPLHGDDSTNDAEAVFESSVTDSIKDRLRSSAKKKLLVDDINWNDIVEASKPRLLFSQGVSKTTSLVKPVHTPPMSTPLSQVLLDITVTSAEKKYLDSPTREDETSPVTEALFDASVLPKTLFTLSENESKQKSAGETNFHEAFLERYKQLRSKSNRVKNSEQLITSNYDFTEAEKNEDIAFKQIKSINSLKTGFHEEEQKFKEVCERLQKEQMFRLTSSKSLSEESKKINDKEMLIDTEKSREASLIEEDKIKKVETLRNDVQFFKQMPQCKDASNGPPLQFELKSKKEFFHSHGEELQKETSSYNEQSIKEKSSLDKDESLNEESLQTTRSSLLDNCELQKDGEEEDQTILYDQEEVTWSDLKLIGVKGNFSIEESNNTFHEEQGGQKVIETQLHHSQILTEEECSKMGFTMENKPNEVSLCREELITGEDLGQNEDELLVTKKKDEMFSEYLQENVEKTSLLEELPEESSIDDKVNDEVIDIASDEEDEVHTEVNDFYSKQFTDEETEEMSEEDTGEELDEEVEEEVSEKEEGDEDDSNESENEGSLPDVSSISSDQGDVENSDESNSGDICESILARYKTEIVLKEKNNKHDSVVILLDDSDDEAVSKKNDSECKQFIEDSESESKISLQEERFNEEDISDTEIFGLKHDKKNVTEDHSEDDIWEGLHSKEIGEPRTLEKEKLDDECLVDCLEVESSQESENPIKELVEIKEKESELFHSKNSSQPKQCSVTNNSNFLCAEVKQTTVEVMNAQSHEKSRISGSDHNIETTVDSQDTENNIPPTFVTEARVFYDDSITEKVEKEEIDNSADFINTPNVCEIHPIAECEQKGKKLTFELPDSVSSICEGAKFGNETKAADSEPLVKDISFTKKKELHAEKSLDKSDIVSDLKEDFQSIERNWTQQIEKEMKQDNVLLNNIESTSTVSPKIGVVQLLDDNNTLNEDLKVLESSINKHEKDGLERSKTITVHAVKLDNVSDSQIVSKESETPFHSSVDEIKDVPMECVNRILNAENLATNVGLRQEKEKISFSNVENKIITNIEIDRSHSECKLTKKEKLKTDIKNLEREESSENTLNKNEGLINDKDKTETLEKICEGDILYCKSESNAKEVSIVPPISNITVGTFDKIKERHENISEVIDSVNEIEKVAPLDSYEKKINYENLKISNFISNIEINDNQVTEVDVSSKHVSESNKPLDVVQSSVSDDIVAEYSGVDKLESGGKQTAASPNLVIKHDLEAVSYETSNKDMSESNTIKGDINVEKAKTLIGKLVLQNYVAPHLEMQKSGEEISYDVAEDTSLNLVSNKGMSVELTVSDSLESDLDRQETELNIDPVNKLSEKNPEPLLSKVTVTNTFDTAVGGKHNSKMLVDDSSKDSIITKNNQTLQSDIGNGKVMSECKTTKPSTLSVINSSEQYNTSSKTCSLESVTDEMEHNIGPFKNSLNLLHINEKEYFRKDNEITVEGTVVSEREVIKPDSKTTEIAIVSKKNFDSDRIIIEMEDKEYLQRESGKYCAEITDKTFSAEKVKTLSEKKVNVLSKQLVLHSEQCDNEKTHLFQGTLKAVDSTAPVSELEIDMKKSSNELSCSSSENITGESICSQKEKSRNKSNERDVVPKNISEFNFEIFGKKTHDHSVTKGEKDCNIVTVDASDAEFKISEMAFQSGNKSSIDYDVKLPEKYQSESAAKGNNCVYSTEVCETSKDVSQISQKESTKTEIESIIKNKQSIPVICGPEEIMVEVDYKTTFTEVPNLKIGIENSFTQNISHKLAAGAHKTVVKTPNYSVDTTLKSDLEKDDSIFDDGDSVKVTISSEHVAEAGIKRTSTNIPAVKVSELNYDNSDLKKSCTLQCNTHLSVTKDVSLSPIIDNNLKTTEVNIEKLPLVPPQKNITDFSEGPDGSETCSSVEGTLLKTEDADLQTLDQKSGTTFVDVTAASAGDRCEDVESKQEIVSFCVDQNVYSNLEPLNYELNDAKMEIANDSSSAGVLLSQNQEGSIKNNDIAILAKSCTESPQKIPSEKSFFFGKEDIDTYIRATKATFQVGSRVSLPDEDEPINPMEIAMIENEDRLPEQTSLASPDINLSLHLSPECLEKPKTVDQGMVTQNSYFQRRARMRRNSEKSVKPPADDCDIETEINVNLQSVDDSSQILAKRELKCISTQTSDSMLEQIELSEPEEESIDSKSRHLKLSGSSKLLLHTTELKIKDKRKIRQSSEPPKMNKEDLDIIQTVKRRNSTRASEIKFKLDPFTEEKRPIELVQEVDIKSILKNRDSFDQKKINVDNSRTVLKENIKMSASDDLTETQQNSKQQNQRSQFSCMNELKTQIETVPPTLIRRSRRLSETNDGFIYSNTEHQRRSRAYSEDRDVFRISSYKEKGRKSHFVSEKVDDIRAAVGKGVQKLRRSRRHSEEPGVLGMLENVEKTKILKSSDNPNIGQILTDLPRNKRSRRCSEEPGMQSIHNNNKPNQRSSLSSDTFSELNPHQERTFKQDRRRLRRHSEEPEVQGILKKRSRGSRRSDDFETAIELNPSPVDFPADTRKLGRSEDSDVQGNLKIRSSKENNRGSHISDTEVEEIKKSKKNLEDAELRGILKKHSKEHRRQSHISEAGELKFHEEGLPEVNTNRRLRRRSEEPEMLGALKTERRESRRSSQSSEIANESKVHTQENFPVGSRRLRRHSEEPQLQGILKKRIKKGSDTIGELELNLEKDFQEQRQKVRTNAEEPVAQEFLKKDSTNKMGSFQSKTDFVSRLQVEEDFLVERSRVKTCVQESDMKGILKKRSISDRKSSQVSETSSDKQQCLEEDILQKKEVLSHDSDSQQLALKTGKRRSYCSAAPDITGQTKHKVNEGSQKSVRQLEEADGQNSNNVVSVDRKEQKGVLEEKSNVSATDLKGKEIKHSRKSLLISKYKDDIDFRSDSVNIKPVLTEESWFKISDSSVDKEEDFEEISAKIIKKVSSVTTNREPIKGVSSESENKGLRKSRRKTPEKTNVYVKTIDERKRKVESEHIVFIPKRLEYSDEDSPDKKKSRSLIDFPIRRNSRLPRPALEDIKEEEEDEAKKGKKSVDDLHLEALKKKAIGTKKQHTAKLVIEESDNESDVSTPELWKKDFTKDKKLTRTQQKLFLLNQQLTSVADVSTSSTSSSPRRSARKKTDVTVTDSPSKTPTRSSLRLKKKPPSETD